ncbi:MAG: hflK protein, partial [Pseudomonadota bacterium]
MVASFFKQLGMKWARYLPILNGRNDGPPDLDQLWRDFNARLSRLLDKSGNNGGNNNSNNNFQPDMKGAGIGAGVIVVIFLILWGMSGFFIVQEGQTGVVTTFGKLSRSTMSGINWRAPYPIQDHEIVNVSQVRTVEVGYRGTSKNKQPKEALMLTDDENIIDIQFAV